MADVLEMRRFYWIPVDHEPGSATRGFRFSGVALAGHRNPTVAEFDAYTKLRGYDDIEAEPRPTDAVSYVYARQVVKRVRTW